MKSMLTRRKRMYVGLMILGAAALFVDRLVLPAGVMKPDASLAETPATPTAGATSDPLPIPELPFPDGLRAFKSDLPVRDFFQPPMLRSSDGSRNRISDNLHPLGRRDNEPGRASRADFVTHHTLNGVLTDQRLRIAIVNGQWMRLGRSVDGCTLTSIAGTEVRFACHDGEAILKLGPPEAVPGG